MSEPRLLHTERLTLRTLDDTFAPQVTAYLAQNRAFAAPWSPTLDDEFFTPAFQRARLLADAEQMRRGVSMRLWLFHRADTRYEQVIGNIGFNNIIHGAFQSCHLGYQLDEAANGSGLMTEALQRAVAWAFSELRLHRIEANIIPRNGRSRRLAQRVGFEEEGYARKYLKINGVWEDHIHYVRLNPEDDTMTG